MVEAGEIHLIINTPLGAGAHDDGRTIRTAAVRYGVPLLTTLERGAGRGQRHPSRAPGQRAGCHEPAGALRSDT